MSGYGLNSLKGKVSSQLAPKKGEGANLIGAGAVSASQGLGKGNILTASGRKERVGSLDRGTRPRGACIQGRQSSDYSQRGRHLYRSRRNDRGPFSQRRRNGRRGQVDKALYDLDWANSQNGLIEKAKEVVRGKETRDRSFDGVVPTKRRGS